MMNQSYERWWEARKIWGEIVNDSRTLVMQLSMYLKPQNKGLEEISHRQIAWNHCLGRHLRKVDSLQDQKKWFSEKDFESIGKSTNRPLSILSLQSQSLAKLYRYKEIDKFSQIQIETTLAKLTSSMGKCERIKNTVFPPIYRYGLHGSIYLFVIFLSLSVAFKLQHFILEFFILVIVSTVFFFLEKAAFRMQDPFENIPTDTPMTFIAEKIEGDILQLLDQKGSSSSKVSDHGYYVL
jgi:putative membrane protein